MYISKRKVECLNVLTLRLKVASKRFGQEFTGSSEWFEAWDVAESAQAAIAYVLGDSDKLEFVHEGERCTLSCYGIKWEGE